MSAESAAELILTPTNKVYHLHLDGADIADTILLVGDPDRVELISKSFDSITTSIRNREFVSVTGTYKNKTLTVLSTGIGPDNIDIVINELDAAANFNLQTRTQNGVHRQLTLIRLGTSGGLQPDLAVGSIVCASHGLGIDGVLNFYAGNNAVCEDDIAMAFAKFTNWPHRMAFPYCVAADNALAQHFGSACEVGITVTAPGFYAPQGRSIRLQPEVENMADLFSKFKFQQQRILNFEMETATMYGLGKMLNHRCLSLCTVIANRSRNEFAKDYKVQVEQLIDYTLNKLLEL